MVREDAYSMLPAVWHADMKKTLSTAFYGRGKRRVYDILIQSEII